MLDIARNQKYPLAQLKSLENINVENARKIRIIYSDIFTTLARKSEDSFCTNEFVWEHESSRKTRKFRIIYLYSYIFQDFILSPLYTS